MKNRSFGKMTDYDKKALEKLLGTPTGPLPTDVAKSDLWLLTVLAAGLGLATACILAAVI